MFNSQLKAFSGLSSRHRNGCGAGLNLLFYPLCSVFYFQITTAVGDRLGRRLGGFYLAFFSDFLGTHLTRLAVQYELSFFWYIRVVFEWLFFFCFGRLVFVLLLLRSKLLLDYRRLLVFYVILLFYVYRGCLWFFRCEVWQTLIVLSRSDSGGSAGVQVASIMNFPRLGDLFVASELFFFWFACGDFAHFLHHSFVHFIN